MSEYLETASGITICGSLNGLPVEPFVLQKKDDKYIVVPYQSVSDNVFKISGFAVQDIINDPADSDKCTIYLTRHNVCDFVQLKSNNMLALFENDGSQNVTIEFIVFKDMKTHSIIKLPKLKDDLYYFKQMKTTTVDDVDYLFVFNREETYIINSITGNICMINFSQYMYRGSYGKYVFFQTKDWLRLYNILTDTYEEYHVEHTIQDIGMNKILLAVHDGSFKYMLPVIAADDYIKNINVDVSALPTCSKYEFICDTVIHKVYDGSNIKYTLQELKHTRRSAKINIYHGDSIDDKNLLASIPIDGNEESRELYCIYNNVIYVRSDKLYVFDPKNEYKSCQINCNYQKIAYNTTWNSKLVSISNKKLVIFDANIIYNIQ